MKIYFNILILILLFVGCKSPKKDHDFTFYKWALHESYYLKFNSTDTLYSIDVFPSEQCSYTILKTEEKEKIQTILDNISFPKETDFSNSSIDDGVTYAFYLKADKQFNQLKIHGNKGPDQFWLFGKTLETIKNQHTFIKINKTFDLSGIDKMVAPPVIFNEK